MLDDMQLTAEERDERIRALMTRCRLDAQDEAKALSVYHGMVEAIADSISAREARASADPLPAFVYVAAYRHRFGVDLSAHATYEDAEARLLAIAWQQCMRDAAIRAAVDARFGPLVADQPPLEPPFAADESEEREPWWDADIECARHPESARPPNAGRTLGVDCADERSARRRTFREQLIEEWPELSHGEQLWIERCAIEREDPLPQVRSDLGDAHAGKPSTFAA